MSYCVNCGVELDASAKKCALCSTPVINPNVHTAVTEEKPFSEELQMPEGIKKRFIAFLLTSAMLVASIVMFFLNVFFIRGNFWSVYVLCAVILVWVLFVFPLFGKKINPFLLWAFDTLAVSGFFGMLFGMLKPNLSVLKCVLAVIVLVSLSVLILMIWLKQKKRHWTSITVILLLESAITSVLSGIAVTFFVDNYNFFVVGIVIGICAFVMMLFFIYCNRSKHIRAWLNKAFYI
ncbi:MAG: hypothetical protein IJO68_02350 [Clostridia bacterium]|nr:hypothetical protein [Clostridia bacterium]